MSSHQFPVDRALYDEVMVPNYAPSPRIPVRGEGSRVWDQDGMEFLDLSGGIAVTSLGHSHPALVAALSEQATSLWHVSNVWTTESAIGLAKRLVDNSFGERVFLCNSGTEANEAALKLARRWSHDHYGSDKREIISFEAGFHGRSLFAVSVGGTPEYTEGFGPLPAGITHLPFDELAALEAAISERTCAVMIEPIQGEGGVRVPSPDFLAGVRRLCDANDALMIIDEVQTGVGRSGRLWAHEHFEVTPDIMTSAKGLGGGFPVAAMVTTERLAASLSPGTHGSTYGGNPMGAAVASAVLDIVDNPEFLDRVTAAGRRAEGGLRRLAERPGLGGAIGEVRGLGLLLGAELTGPLEGRAGEVVKASMDHGVMVLRAGTSVVRIAPSLLITDEEIDEGIERLGATLEALT